MREQISRSPGDTAGRALVALGLALGLGACAVAPRVPAQQPSPSATEPPPEPEPATAEQAEAQLERGAAALKKALSGRIDGDGAQPPAQAQPAPSQPQGAGVSPGPAPREEHRKEVCVEVCRALASMRRATEVLCRLAGPEDARCQAARRRVQEGEVRASPCGC